MKVPGDPLPQDTGLGELVKKPAMPVPHKKIREGVFQSPDGKFYTTDQPPPIPVPPTA